MKERERERRVQASGRHQVREGERESLSTDQTLEHANYSTHLANLQPTIRATLSPQFLSAYRMPDRYCIPLLDTSTTAARCATIASTATPYLTVHRSRSPVAVWFEKPELHQPDLHALTAPRHRYSRAHTTDPLPCHPRLPSATNDRCERV